MNNLLFVDKMFTEPRKITKPLFQKIIRLEIFFHAHILEIIADISCTYFQDNQ